jgi:aldehyde dehydrogenase (NAD+)
LNANCFGETAGAATMDEKQMLIAGEWISSEDGSTSTVIDPSCGEEIAAVPTATESCVERAVGAANAAILNPEWSRMDGSARGRLLNKMAAVTYSSSKDLATIESQNNGKTFREALGEIRYAAWTLEYYAGWADKIEGETIPVPGPRLNYTLRQPLGTTVHIIPWNFPLQLAIRSIAPALAAGCSVIAKPASLTPLSLLAWCRALDEADSLPPASVLQVITGPGGRIGAQLAGHPDIDGVVLTGGVPTGQRVMVAAAENLTPITLELGGKGANIVFSDADIGRAAKAICYGIWMNAGQMCWAGSRLIVHQDVHADLLEAISTEIETWTLGPGLSKGVRIGSMVSKEHRASVLKILETGLATGGTLIRGGGCPGGELESGAFMEPTIVDEVPSDNVLFTEELFGPVLAVTTFAEDKEAIMLANKSEFGLLNGIWTNQLGRAHMVAAALECGMVNINEYPVTFPMTAFTGWKKSGIGIEQSKDALRFYSRLKNVTINLR